MSSGLPVVIGLILFAVIGASFIKGDFRRKRDTLIDQARRLADKGKPFLILVCLIASCADYVPSREYSADWMHCQARCGQRHEGKKACYCDRK